MIVRLSNEFKYLFQHMEIKYGINLLGAFPRLKSGLADIDTVTNIYQAYLMTIKDPLEDPLLNIVLRDNLAPRRDEVGITTRNTAQILNELTTENIININIEIVNVTLDTHLRSDLYSEHCYSRDVFTMVHLNKLNLVNLFNSGLKDFLLTNKSLKLCYRLYNQWNIPVDVDNFMVYRFAKENNCLNSVLISDIILRNWFDKQVFAKYLNEDILTYAWDIYFNQPI